MQACGADNREIPPMLNQSQHRLKCLIISVMAEHIQDSLSFTMFFLGGGGVSEHVRRSVEELSICWHAADCVAEYSRDKLLTWEHSQG